jgi:hypothetical protein
MKTNLLPASLLALAAVVALLASPVAACGAFAVTGVLAVFLGDYRRSLRPVGAAA